MSNKICKVIARGKVEFGNVFNREDGKLVTMQQLFENVPEGTPIEIVAITKPERVMIEPEIKLTMEKDEDGDVLCIRHASGLYIASITCVDGKYHWIIEGELGEPCETVFDAIVAAKEMMADEEYEGFRWESSVEYEWYEIEAWYRNSLGTASGHANRDFDTVKLAFESLKQEAIEYTDCTKLIIWGRIGEERHEIDRWE